LGDIDHLFKIRFTALAISHRGKLHELVGKNLVGDEVDERKFHKMIHDYVDDGIPLLWSLELGIYAEEPAIAQQAGGGHMRMIIGYNDTTNRVIFTDSWGAGHEFKTMDADDCYKATHGLFLLKPTVR
ncbi:MAG: C39 family peptidase, partial [Verrucomicrobiales bacterium]